MSRRLRWIEPHFLTEITDRGFQGRFLLRPSPQLNRLVIGIFARAKELYPLQGYAARVAGIDYKLSDFATEYELHFDPLPCRAISTPRSPR